MRNLLNASGLAEVKRPGLTGIFRLPVLNFAAGGFSGGIMSIGIPPMKIILPLVGILLAIPSSVFAVERVPPAKPNIIVILADDMGFSDIGCYGGEIPTPNIDRLAAGGLRFTQFYNAGRCCPSRASLLTGLYPHETGVGNMTFSDQKMPGYRGRLNESCVTLAEVLRPAGYFTAISGKWHVGQEQGVVPWERGFDRSLEAPTGGFYRAGSPRAELFLNGKALSNDDPRLPKNWYVTDLWTDFGLKFIDEARAARKPFFLYLAHIAPHFPLQASAGDIARFRGRYKAGWDRLREERLARQVASGLIDPAWGLAPRPPGIKAWDELTAAEQDRFDHIMAVYAACVYRLDLAVGRLVEGLRERNELDNTLILFLSDNGGNAESGPDGRTEGDPTEAASVWYCGESWALLQNTPFRRYKHFSHEGGIATPLIARWPAGIRARGETRRQVGHIIDLMPTLAEIGGATYPAEFHGHAIQPAEGRSLVPAFADLPVERDALYWEHQGNAAVRVGDWKLVRAGRGGPWELYDLKSDRTELHDLAGVEPARAAELAARWDAWAVRAHVVPYPPARKQAAAKRKQAAAQPARDSDQR